MPHGIVDCFAGKKQLGFVEALQVGMCLGYIYCILSTIVSKMYLTMYPCVCVYMIQLLFNTVQSSFLKAF
jgi:hypothetical protein